VQNYLPIEESGYENKMLSQQNNISHVPKTNHWC